MTSEGNDPSWFVKNEVKPRAEKMDKPGYVVAKIGGKSKLREVILPEQMLIKIEDAIEQNFGQEGKKLLYSTGKEWGWRYAMISHFPRLEDSTNSEVEEFIDLFVKYIEAVYADEIDYDLDLDNTCLDLRLNDYIVCRKNGKGYILTTGVWAGALGYLFSDQSLEGVKLNCQGEGDKNCEVRFKSEISSKSDTMRLKLPDKELGFHKNYSDMNQIKDLESAKNSTVDLLKREFLNYTSEGEIKYQGNRMFVAESSMLYLLEKKLSRIDGAQDILFQQAFDVGRGLGEGKNLSFITDYIPALGFGGIKLMRNGARVIIVNYPWTRFSRQGNYTVIRGLLSGIMSGIRGEQMTYKDHQISFSSGNFILTLS